MRGRVINGWSTLISIRRGRKSTSLARRLGEGVCVCAREEGIRERERESVRQRMREREQKIKLDRENFVGLTQWSCLVRPFFGIEGGWRSVICFFGVG